MIESAVFDMASANDSMESARQILEKAYMDERLPSDIRHNSKVALGRVRVAMFETEHALKALGYTVGQLAEADWEETEHEPGEQVSLF